MSRRHSIRLLLLVAGVLPCAAGQAAAASTYKFTVFGVPTATQTLQTGLTDAGVVLGNWVDSANATHGYLYSAGTFTQLDVPGASSTLANGINNEGVVVGSYDDASHTTHAFTYRNGTYTSFDVPNAIFSQFDAVNDAGTIAGDSLDASGHGSVFTLAGSQLTTVISKGNAFPTGIGPAGNVVGIFNTHTGNQLGFAYRNGHFSLLRIGSSTLVNPTGTNGRVIAGYYFDSVVKGFIARAGKITDLMVPGETDTFANAVNAAGTVVGEAFTTDAARAKGFVYSGGTYSNLIVPGQANTYAQSINKSGAIAGTAGGEAFIAIPTATAD